jgi:hypothetical protein
VEREPWKSIIRKQDRAAKRAGRARGSLKKKLQAPNTKLQGNKAKLQSSLSPA